VTNLQTIVNTIGGGLSVTTAAGADYREGQCNDAGMAPCQRDAQCLIGVTCDGGQDRWMQDAIEIGFTSSPTDPPLSVMHSVFDGARSRGLDGYARRELLGSETAIFEAPPDVATGDENSLDSFGNLEVTPPLTAEGKDWLLGRIYYGGRPGGCDGGTNAGGICNRANPTCPNGLGGFVRCNLRMQPEVRDFLDAQEVQGPVEVDSDWLLVGHVDEFISFVPFPNAGVNDKRFKVLLASPRRAIALLEAESAAGRGGTLVDILTNPPLVTPTYDDVIADYKAQNIDDWQPAIDDVKCVMMARFGLVEADFIEIPVLFDRWFADGDFRAEALLPDMVNLVVANAQLIVPEPFLDLFKDDFETKLGAIGYQPSTAANPTIHFIDDYIWYHKAIGEVHCGTNSLRTIPLAPPWWTQQ
jgi:protein-arginine deiminase